MKKVFATIVTLFLFVMCVSPVFAYEVNQEFMLNNNQGSQYQAQNNYIIVHETANATATARNEAVYMSRNYNNAYTTYIIGDGGKVYQIKPDGFISWGAGQTANANSPIQIELQHSLDPAVFKANYTTYIQLIRDKAMKYNIPLTLDSAYPNRGIKSHLWVSQNFWGDHSDPYSYLEKMGVSKAQFARDIANGVSQQVVNQQTTNQQQTTSNKTNQMIYQVDDLQFKFGLWQVKSNYLVPADFNWYENGIAVGDITLVDKDGNVLADQMTKQGSYFIIDQDKATVITQARLGSGNYYWSLVKTANGGNVWLSVWNTNHLFFGK